MALSLLSQKPSFTDLQTFFDPFSLQQFQQNQQQRHFISYNDFDQMECNNRNNNQRQLNQHPQHNYMHQQQQQQQQQHHYPISHNHNKKIDPMHNIDNSGSNSSSSDSSDIHHQQIAITSQANIQLARSYMNGYHHHHIGSNYEQVISFVDSPPNSEESWTDEQSKASPGPQIIDVQTLYQNSSDNHSGSRKRRMDWDALDIDQNDSTASGTTPTTSAQTVEPITTKTAIQNDKDKHKREKLSGRASWTDELGFDLNAEFNSNSYLNNEPFLSFSQSLNALKQEPQTEHLKSSKSPLHSIAAKADKIHVIHGTANANEAATASAPATPTRSSNTKTEIKPNAQQQQNSAKVYETNINNILETNSTGIAANRSASTADASKYNSCANNNNNNSNNTNNNNGISVIQQQLTVLDANKIENSATSAVTTTLHIEEHKFQYILAAATSIATKNNEETLTYLNQGQSYEIKLKKIGDLSFYRDKILKSVIKICFHERRLQYMEREQMQQWQASRPGERIIEVDVPLSYGLCHVSQPLNPTQLNTVEVFWDPLKEVGVYIKVNCISTEFTPKKHGGEKGVPFRLQIETYIENTNSSTTTATATTTAAAAAATTIAAAQSPSTLTTSPSTNTGNMTPNSKLACLPLVGSKQPVHAAACQIKVFKLKGADRKHKQDREKIQKRSQSEQEKFQPSYECTIMNDVSLDMNVTTSTGCYSPEYLKIWPNSPVHIPKYDGILPYANHQSPAATAAVCSSPIAINSVTSTNSPNIKMMDTTTMVSPQHVPADIDDYIYNVLPDSTPAQVAQWLTQHRLTAYIPTFAQFCGADIMRMSKDDLIQICGLADGIRMFNILRAKAISPRLTFYVSLDGSNYNAIYLLTNTAKELIQKLYKLPGFYEIITKCSNPNMENGVGSLYNAWSMHSKYSGSGSNIFNDVNKSAIYVTGPAGIHVTITDEVLNNEIKDGSLYALEVQNGKIIMKLLNKNDN